MLAWSFVNLLVFFLTAYRIHYVDCHAYLSVPISRNAVGEISRGYCTWGGEVPCQGCPHCWNTEEPTTGCGIMQGGGGPYVFGDGGLSYGNTGVKTTYNQGQLIDVEVIISTYHGGKFSFYIQDVGDNADPDGSLWKELAPLTIETHSPTCDQGYQAPYGCAEDPCREEKTCMYIPLQPYGDHNYFYTMKVKLPDDLVCEHCVLQWWWLTSNSCPGDYVACEGSEEFWNCADLTITANGLPQNQPTVGPAQHPSGSCSRKIGDSRCSGHGQKNCDLGSSSFCWRPVWSWPNDYCELENRPCQPWESEQGGNSWQSCCEWNDHCRGTGLVEPQLEQECADKCICFDGWEGESCGICLASPTLEPTSSSPAYHQPTGSTVAPSVESTPSPTPLLSSTQAPSIDVCADKCYANVPLTWYSPLLDAWCLLECDAFTGQFQDRCITGCRPETRRLTTVESWTLLISYFLHPKTMSSPPAAASGLRG